MNDSMPTSRRAAPANSNPTGEFPAGAVGEFPANGLNTLSTEVRRFGFDEVVVGAAFIVTKKRTGVRMRGGVHSDVWPETVNVSAARPATACGRSHPVLEGRCPIHELVRDDVVGAAVLGQGGVGRRCARGDTVGPRGEAIG